MEAAPTRCSDCAIALASVECCRQPFCLLHAHCSRHALHPAMWRVLNKAEHARTVAAVDAFRASAIAQLEADLEAAESRLALGAESLSGAKRHAGEDLVAHAPSDFVPVPAMQRPGARRRAQRVPVAPPLGSAYAPPPPEPPTDDDDPFARRNAVPVNIWERSRPLAPPRAARDFAGLSPRPSQSQPAGAPRTQDLVASESADPGLRLPLPDVLASAGVIGVRASVRKLLAETMVAACKADSAAAIDASRIVTGSGSAGGATESDPLVHKTAWVRAASREEATFAVITDAAAAALAAAIEAAVLSAFGGSNGSDPDAPAYRDRCRALAHALRDPENRALRDSVCSGSLPPGVFASLPFDALANPHARAASSAIRSADETGRAFTHESWTSSAYVCPACSAAESEYREHGNGAADSRKAEVRGENMNMNLPDLISNASALSPLRSGGRRRLARWCTACGVVSVALTGSGTCYNPSRRLAELQEEPPVRRRPHAGEVPHRNAHDEFSRTRVWHRPNGLHWRPPPLGACGYRLDCCRLRSGRGAFQLWR